VRREAALAIRLALLIGFAALAGCERQEPVKGFVLPRGNADHGLDVFVQFNCHHCHSIPDVVLPDRGFDPPFVVTLGGEVQRVKNYGELLTAIVYPDHIISPKYRNLLMQAGKNPDLTPMPYFGDSMTVTQLTDLVEFLHGQYKRLMPVYYKSHYPVLR
jgi:sulfur-oxidizing protein SoxX